ncbi:MAG: efflux RND transporter periplasmic adaptor subunit [Spirochaetaceae bacterium]|jgi:multidrug efflux pump subunit AcrA (membrane-fusion protein)|nr:efflux RND transporter periplasmic adaptor subunit [Spirochaetaceae bacterium]
MKKIKINIFAKIAALGILALAGCRQGEAGDPGKPGGPDAPPAAVFAVNTIAAVQGQIRDYLALSGDIVAGSSVDVYSDVAGKVSRLRVAVGDRITRNQPVAEVDPSRPGMDYVASVVRAPIAGTITALPAQVGMTVSQAVPLARIAGGSALEIKLYVAERFISKMARGLPCEITLDAWPGEVFRGSVTEVSPVVDPGSRTMEVRVNVDNQGGRLKAGMFAKVRIIIERKEDIVKIPSSAMVQRFGEDYVFTAEQDLEDPSVLVARRKLIVPGITVDGVMEVAQGLRPDEDVIIKGHTLLEDGARINIIDRVPPLSEN